MQYVTVNIEDLKVGDWVYSYDTLTGEVMQSQVTATFALTSNRINYLTIVDENGNEQVIETTDPHPFWVVTDEPDLERAARSVVDENGVILYHANIGPGLNGFWVEAKDLREGDVFLGANGELSTLTNIVRVEQSGGIAVFNFTVEGNHNYFILAKEYEYGQTCVLVHNARCDTPIHHIATDKHHSIYTPQFKKIFDEAGLRMQSPYNRMRLPGHKGPHTKEYHGIVLGKLKSAVSAAKTKPEKLAALKSALMDLRFDIRFGDLKKHLIK